jgi:hypothetical protein
MSDPDVHKVVQLREAPSTESGLGMSDDFRLLNSQDLILRSLFIYTLIAFLYSSTLE